MSEIFPPPGPAGYFEGTDKDGRLWRIPRIVDPATDGTILAAAHPRVFDTSAPNDSIELEDFDRLMAARMPAEVHARIDRVIAAAKTLHLKGLADAPPQSEAEWRRGLILSWSHAQDLTVLHDAIGHPRYTKGHDVDELVLAKRLQENLTSADYWYRDYVASLDEGAWVNVGFFNPHLSASMYRWGDVGKGKDSIQNAMNAHRLSSHHNGSPERPLDWVERALNFVIHHIPREHWGIRHEPRGAWSDLEPRLAEDPSINRAEIGKQIARDAAMLAEQLELEGKIVPWQLLKLNDHVPAAAMEHATLIVAGAKVVTSADECEAANPDRVLRAEALLSSLPARIATAKSSAQYVLAAHYEQWLNSDA